jgi:DNA-binding SARP family transcriptional activator
MRCYCALGDRPKAIQQFEICADMLKREFQIEPMPETLALYTEIRDGSRGLVMQQPGAFPVRRPRGEVTLDEKVDRALARLQAAQQSLDEARQRLRRGLEDVERLLDKDKH